MAGAIRASPPRVGTTWFEKAYFACIVRAARTDSLPAGIRRRRSWRDIRRGFDRDARRLARRAAVDVEQRVALRGNREDTDGRAALRRDPNGDGPRDHVGLRDRGDRDRDRCRGKTEIHPPGRFPFRAARPRRAGPDCSPPTRSGEMPGSALPLSQAHDGSLPRAAIGSDRVTGRAPFRGPPGRPRVGIRRADAERRVRQVPRVRGRRGWVLRRSRTRRTCCRSSH